MEDLKNGSKWETKGLKDGLTKFLQEMLPSGDKVLHENHDEDKRNTNFDFRDSNYGLTTRHIPNIDMRRFDDKDPIIDRAIL